jgi:hypothetical protein
MRAGARGVVPGWMVAAFWVAIVAVYLALRAVCLDADAPRRLAHGGIGTELLVEPVAKSHEARNWAMTGKFQTNPADNYQFWRPQAPFWVYPVAGMFRAFGVSYATLRVTATIFGILGLVGVVLFSNRRWGPSGALLAGVFFATDNVGVFFGRSGLLEPIVAAWLMLAVYALDRAFDHVAWLLVAVGLTVLAAGTKLACLPALPVFALYGMWLLRKPAGVKHAMAWRLGIVAVTLAVFGSLVAYALTEDFQRTLTWNFRHMVLGQEGGTKFDLDSVDPDAIGPGLGQLPQRMRVYWCAFSAVGVAGLIEAGWRSYELVKKKATFRDVLPVAMLLSFMVAVFGATFFAYRFVLLLGPPLLVLSVDFAHRMAAKIRERKPALTEKKIYLTIAGLYAVSHVAAWGYAVSRLTYEVRAAADVVQETIGDRTDAVCIGLWSAPLIVETTCTHFYVKRTFNSTKEQLVALKPTHLFFLDEKDDTMAIVKSKWPELYEARKPVQRFEIRGFGLEFFEVGRLASDPPPRKKDGAPKKKKKRPEKAGDD